jgi:hypothetical protein
MEEKQFGTILVLEDGSTIDLVSVGLVEYNPFEE